MTEEVPECTLTKGSIWPEPDAYQAIFSRMLANDQRNYSHRFSMTSNTHKNQKSWVCSADKCGYKVTAVRSKKCAGWKITGVIEHRIHSAAEGNRQRVPNLRHIEATSLKHFEPSRRYVNFTLVVVHFLSGSTNT